MIVGIEMSERSYITTPRTDDTKESEDEEKNEVTEGTNPSVDGSPLQIRTIGADQRKRIAVSSSGESRCYLLQVSCYPNCVGSWKGS